MDKRLFIKNFAAQFEETDPGMIDENTHFKNLEEWGSLTALSIIAMTDEAYEVRLSGKDIQNSTTVSDLFEIIASRIK